MSVNELATLKVMNAALKTTGGISHFRVPGTRSHHEIPLGRARIGAVADVFAALTWRLPHKPAGRLNFPEKSILSQSLKFDKIGGFN